MGMVKNIFCSVSDLHTEADVEALFAERLFNLLGYPDEKVCRKESLDELQVSRGRQKEPYRPDYVPYDGRKQPVIVFDAKRPSEKPDDYRYQVAGYALALNSRFSGNNPVKYVVVSSGVSTVLWAWDNSEPLMRLGFAEFDCDCNDFIKFRSLLSYGASEATDAVQGVFAFCRPSLSDLLQAFDVAHQVIWKKEKIGPTDAFYEFTKLMFVKLREDHRIYEKIKSGDSVSPSDFSFSVQWIRQQEETDVSPNPVADVLFERVRAELERSIQKGILKRIFEVGERLTLKPSTITEVVEIFENYDLHGMDEDLNGRMFETFLNATVRGKELGQFFTPRSVVKYMTKCADLSVRRDFTPRVLDGCCGSGGFLIEAMACLTYNIAGLKQLTTVEREERLLDLHRNRLYGIEANPKVTRVARLNMYLHGDGGSRIYTADTLDKEMITEEGTDDESLRWMEELKHELVDGNGKMKFDVVLTNPPFSMSYKRNNTAEARMLSQYDRKLAKGKSVQSNVLFLERYWDLLMEGGELLTIIDNTVLNGTDSQHVRDFILRHFVIKQVVSLPFNAFIRADTGVQTSILHLVKKSEGDVQGDVFMGILNNIGHDDYKRQTPERDNTNYLFNAWTAWNTMGCLEDVVCRNQSDDENLGCDYQVFIVESDKLCKSRLDAFYYAPALKTLRSGFEARRRSGELEIWRGDKFNLVKQLTQPEVKANSEKVFRYFDIGDVTRDGQIAIWKRNVLKALSTRARIKVQTGDILFAKNISSRGKTVLVPPEWDGQLASNGFLAVRPRDECEGYLLWSIMSSEAFRMQVYYLAVTAVQPEIRPEIFRREFMVPVPKERLTLIRMGKDVFDSHARISSVVSETRDVSEKMFGVSGD